MLLKNNIKKRPGGSNICINSMLLIHEGLEVMEGGKKGTPFDWTVKVEGCDFCPARGRWNSEALDWGNIFWKAFPEGNAKQRVSRKRGAIKLESRTTDDDEVDDL